MARFSKMTTPVVRLAKAFTVAGALVFGGNALLNPSPEANAGAVTDEMKQIQANCSKLSERFGADKDAQNNYQRACVGLTAFRRAVHDENRKLGDEQLKQLYKEGRGVWVDMHNSGF